MMHFIDNFRQAIEAAGLTPPTEIHGDGHPHRFSTNGKHNDDAGWYVLYSDGIPAGAFGCWRSDIQSTWCSKLEHDLTDDERYAMRERVQAMKYQREQECAERRADAKKKAGVRLAQSEPVAQHPYLTAKGIKPYGARLDGVDLVIPMRDTAGILHSLQIIKPNGGKLFLSGGKVEGCYFSMGKPDTILIICEGFATGASIYESTGHAVAVAFNAGNLGPVATALRAKFPELKLVLAADDDYRTDGNPGLTKASAAALAVDGLIAIPTFPNNRSDKATDFNDLYLIAGQDAVRSCIEAAQKPVARVTTDHWPVPIPLPDSLPAVLPFDPDLLPHALRGWVMDIAHRMQCPPDFPAVGAIVALSSLIGARAVVQPKARDTWQVVPNLWGLIVGRPGVMKSPALGESLKPIQQLQTKEKELWQVAHDAWAVDAKLAKLRTSDNEKKASNLANKDPLKARELLSQVDTPEEPEVRRFIVNDTTVEKLGELLKENPWGLLTYRDEIYGLLTSMDRQGQESSRAFFLQAYDGNQGYTFDRIGRGEVHIPRVCLAMIGGIQPGRVQEYVRGAVAGGSADDGLLQRFGLTVWPDVTTEFRHVDEWPDAHAKQGAWAVFERLAVLEPASGVEPHIWRFDPAAQALFVEWLVPFETEIRGDGLHSAMVSHLSKFRKLVPALALIFSLVDTPDSGGAIGKAELTRALAWSEYLRSHANRLYAAAVLPETANATSLLKKVRTGVLSTIFTPREVAQKGWAGLTTPDAVRKAADTLVEFDWLRREVQPSRDALGRGRPSECYLVNPSAFSTPERRGA